MSAREEMIPSWWAWVSLSVVLILGLVVGLLRLAGVTFYA
jgi:hypothetical protein